MTPVIVRRKYSSLDLNEQCRIADLSDPTPVGTCLWRVDIDSLFL